MATRNKAAVSTPEKRWKEAKTEAVRVLISHHPTEFAEIFAEEKEKRGIVDRAKAARQRKEEQLAALAAELGVEIR
jgi:NAD(P)H-hydrate repair Nnr-like enzyme with NAD(P)H-hydrate dehydratase domain